MTQYKLQIASLDAQVARDEAELAGKPLTFGQSNDPEVTRYNALQKALYDQRVAQYSPQVNSYDSKISQTEATIQKSKKDDERYSQRAEIAGKIEDMRSTLAESGSGSKLNLYLSQDNRLELLRQIDNTHNALLEAQHQLESLKADRKAFAEQWNAQLTLFQGRKAKRPGLFANWVLFRQRFASGSFYIEEEIRSLLGLFLYRTVKIKQCLFAVFCCGNF